MNASVLGGMLIKLILAGCVFWVLWWGLNRMGLPEPFNKIAVVVLVLLTVVVLLQIFGMATFIRF